MDVVFRSKVVEVHFMTLLKLCQGWQKSVDSHALEPLLQLDKGIELSIKIGDDHVEFFLFVYVFEPAEQHIGTCRRIGYLVGLVNDFVHVNARLEALIGQANDAAIKRGSFFQATDHGNTRSRTVDGIQSCYTDGECGLIHRRAASTCTAASSPENPADRAQSWQHLPHTALEWLL